MNIKEIGKKAVVPAISALVGGLVVFAALKFYTPAVAQVNAEVNNDQNTEQVYDDIFKKQESIYRQFDSLFNDDFISRNDPFEEMKKMRDQMQKRMEFFDSNSSSKINPFDSWFSGKFGGGSINDISKREDDNYVYYDIKVGNLSSASINTKIEQGYISISGTEEKKSGSEGESDSGSTQSVFKSSFSRTFPLPQNVEHEKMQMLKEEDKVVLKFPKKKV